MIEGEIAYLVAALLWLAGVVAVVVHKVMR